MRELETITSRTNPRIKELLELKNSGSHYFVEGYRIIDEILKSDINPDIIIFTSEAAKEDVTNKAKFMTKLETIPVSSIVFDKLSNTREPQGLAAYFKKPEHNTDNICNSGWENGIFLMLQEIQDPGNLGTIFRTARAAGVAGIFLSRKSVSVSNDKVIRASMGAVFTVPFVENINSDEVINIFKKYKITIAAADAKTGKNIYDLEYKLPICFLLGSEAHGISADFLKHSDITIKIPIIKQIESLNLSISAGILMYDAVKRFKLYNLSQDKKKKR